MRILKPGMGGSRILRRGCGPVVAEADSYVGDMRNDAVICRLGLLHMRSTGKAVLITTFDFVGGN